MDAGHAAWIGQGKNAPSIGEELAIDGNVAL